MSSSKRPDLVIYKCERPGLQTCDHRIETQNKARISHIKHRTAAKTVNTQTSVPSPVSHFVHTLETIFNHLCAVEIYLTPHPSPTKIQN